MTRASLLAVAAAATIALAATAAPPPATAAAPAGSIAGVLTDHAGTPTVGLRVYAYPAGDPQKYVSRGALAPDGSFTVADLPPGAYKLMIATSLGVSWADGQLTFDAATAYPVAAGETSRVAARLPEPATVAGRLTDRAGAPVAGATVTLLNPAATTSPANAFPPVGSTDADGRYAVPAVPVSYAVSFRAGQLTQYQPSTADPAQARVHALAPGKRKVLDETLLRHGTVGGRLTRADDAPAPAVEVRLRAGSTIVGTTHTDAHGRYEFGRAFTGGYQVSFHAPDSGVQWAPGRLAAPKARTYPVRDGQRTTVDDRLLGTGTLRGRVTAPDGAAAPAGTPVELYREGDTPGPAGFVLVRRAQTGADGAYAFATAPAGKYHLAFPRGTRAGQLQWAPGATAPPAAPRLTVRPGEVTTADERLLPVGGVAGTLTGADGAPARLAAVRVHDETAAAVGTLYADADGRYSFDGIFPGRYKLSFQQGKGTVQWAVGKATFDDAAWVTVAPGATAVVDDTLRG